MGTLHPIAQSLDHDPVRIKTTDLKLMASSPNPNDIIAHRVSQTFNLRRSTIRLFRWILGEYAISGMVEDSVLGLSKRLDYSYRTLHACFHELEDRGLLVRGSDKRLYIHGGILQGLPTWEFRVSVEGGEYPRPEL